MEKIPSVKEVIDMMEFAEKKQAIKPHPSTISDKSFENRQKLIGLLNSELKNKSLLITELYEALTSMKQKILSMEKILKLSEEENTLLTVKNKFLQDELEIYKTQAQTIQPKK